METVTLEDSQSTSQEGADAGTPGRLIDAAVTRRGLLRGAALAGTGEGMFGTVNTLIVTPTKVDLTPLLT